METGFIHTLGRLALAVPERTVMDVAPPPTDVAPLPSTLGLTVGVAAGLCCLVVVVAVVAFFVIRAIKKNNATKNNP